MKLKHKHSRKAGLPPGTLVHIGEKKSETVTISVYEYGEGQFQERTVSKPDEIAMTGEPTVRWVDVGGIHKMEVLESFGKMFGLHPLLLEDIANTDQRPKLDDYGSYGYVVLKMLYEGDREGDINVEQVSLVFGENFLLSFQENGGDVFQGVKERLRNGKGRLRHAGADYLLYALMDSIVDRYFVILETLGERIEALQDLCVTNLVRETLRDIHGLKRQLLFLRRSVWPLRDVMNNCRARTVNFCRVRRSVFPRWSMTTSFRSAIRSRPCAKWWSVHDGSVSLQRELSLERRHEVLTIITTIFMPLSFIASIYGMNFEHMPELKSPWGYPAVLGVMAATGLAMLYFFKQKKWL
jgi:magnesium transporter